MLVVLSAYKGDVDRLVEVCTWVRQLGSCKEHEAVIVCDPATPAGSVIAARNEAAKSFHSVSVITSPKSVTGWIAGANALWLTAAKHAQEKGSHWLWLESDATPLKPGWIDQIDIHYRARGHRYFGSIVPCDQLGLPERHLAGVAVYPADAYNDMHAAIEKSPNAAFDISTAAITVPQAMDSYLFQHLWGEKDRPPRFASKGVPQTEVFGLDYIRPDAVLFHRVKDGSLIRLLRQRERIPKNDPVPITVVFAFCNKDGNLMAKSLEWMTHLHGKLPRTCVLHFDGTVTSRQLQEIAMSANQVFQTVLRSQYPTPHHPWLGWPGACNWSFREACKFIYQHLDGPWLFFESDSVVLTHDWLYQLENEYAIGGKTYMGTVISELDGLTLGHFNGGGVYPADMLVRAPKALENPRSPWDIELRAFTEGQVHPANHIMVHCGAVVNGCCKWGNGPPNDFPTQSDLDRLIAPEVVFFHPSKNGSLIDRLKERHHGQNS